MPTYGNYSQWASTDDRGSRYSWAPAMQNYFKKANKPVSYDDRKKYAESLGYRTRGDQAISTGPGGHEMTTDLRYLQPPRPSMQNALREDLFNAFQQDSQNIQGAADRHRALMLGQADRHEQEMYGDIANITQSYADADGLLGSLDAELGPKGDQAAANIRGAGDPGFDKAEKMFGESYDLAKGVATRDPGIDEAYQDAADKYAQDIADYETKGQLYGNAMAAGQTRNAAMQRKLQGQTDAAGRDLTGGQQSALDMAFDREGAAAAANAANQTWAHVNDNVLQAKTQLAGMRQKIGDARGQEVSLQLSGISAMETAASGTSQNAAARAANAREAEQARLAYDNLRTSVRQMWAGIKTQGPQVVAQLRAQGREMVAGFIERNPESVTSMSQYIMAFMAANNAMNMAAGGGGGGSWGGGGDDNKPSGGTYGGSWGTTKFKKGGGTDWAAPTRTANNGGGYMTFNQAFDPGNSVGSPYDQPDPTLRG